MDGEVDGREIGTGVCIIGGVYACVCTLCGKIVKSLTMVVLSRNET